MSELLTGLTNVPLTENGKNKLRIILKSLQSQNY